MLEKIKKVFKKKKPTVKKVIINMDDLNKGLGVNTKKEVKSEVKSETKSSLTFGN